MSSKPEAHGLSTFDTIATEYLEQTRQIDGTNVATAAQNAELTPIQDKVWESAQRGILAEGQVAWNKIIEWMTTKDFEPEYAKRTHINREYGTFTNFTDLVALTWATERLWRPADTVDVVNVRTVIGLSTERRNPHLNPIQAAIDYQDMSGDIFSDWSIRQDLKGTRYEVKDYSIFHHRQSKRDLAGVFKPLLLNGVQSLDVSTTYDVLGSTAPPKTSTITIQQPRGIARLEECVPDAAEAQYRAYVKSKERANKDYFGFQKWLAKRVLGRLSENVQNITSLSEELSRS